MNDMLKFIAFVDDVAYPGYPMGEVIEIDLADKFVVIKFPDRPIPESFPWGRVKIMQYTGKKDNTGVEIYEGDIVTYRCQFVEYENGYDIAGCAHFWEYFGVVKITSYSGVMIKVFKRISYESEFDGEFEVIKENKLKSIPCSNERVLKLGNICENPDMVPE